MDKKIYDFVVSIGEDCACTGYLRRHKLQEASYPFDWLTFAPFENRIELINNDFQNFLNFEDLEFLPKNPEKNNDAKCDYYKNKVTKFYFYHDFDAGKPLSETFDKVREKYKRRIERFYRRIYMSESVLFVWLSRNKKISDDVLIKSYNTLKNKFKDKHIDFLILENDSSEKHFRKSEISPNITKYIYDNASYDFSNPLAECMGNIEATDKLFSNITLKYTVKKRILKFFINFIPVKRIRKILRRDFL